MSRENSRPGRADDHRPLAVVILAAGQGTRMKSRRSKVLHEIVGRPMLGHPLAAAEGLEPDRLIVVIGRDADEVRRAFAGRADFAIQAEQRGTGHAVLQTASKLSDFRGDILVMYGDTPLLRTESLAGMRSLKQASGAGLVMLSALAPLPGRVVRDAAGHVERIVEVTDATAGELAIEEGNTGVYLVDSDLLWEGLDQVDDRNEQGEIYLTDVVAYAVSCGRGVEAMLMEDPDESLGVNNRQELAEAARLLRRRLADLWMSEGVTLEDPATTYLDVDVSLGRDVVVESGCRIRGASSIGEGARLRAGCVIEQSEVGAGADLGPHLHLPPGARVAAGSRLTRYGDDPGVAGARRQAARKRPAARRKAAAKKKTAKRPAAKKRATRKQAAEQKVAKKKTAKKVAKKRAARKEPARRSRR